MFSFTAPNTKCNITVGYISSERGFVEGVGLYEANHYAKLNPGTQFIFRNRDFVKYLNINEVNALEPKDLLPNKRSGSGSCSGIVGLNLEGDTSRSTDDGKNYKLDPAYTGGSTQFKDVQPERDKVSVDFYGGGGVGVQAAPIIGIDGSVLAVQVINGGYGYKYPPIVEVHDDTGKGAGVVAQSIIKTHTSQDTVVVEEFDREEDFENYELDKCVPELENIGYGQRWGPDGKNLGKWDPLIYFNKSKDPISYEIQRYQKFLATIKDGSRIDGNRIKGWWTTRQKVPLRVTSGDKVTREKFDVQHPAWGGLITSSGVSNSNVDYSENAATSTFGISTGYVETSFLVYTSGGQRRELAFTFTSMDGKHSFIIRADDFKDNASAEEIKVKVRRNTKYKVVSSRRGDNSVPEVVKGAPRRGGTPKDKKFFYKNRYGYGGSSTEQGLLVESSFGGRGKEQDTGTSSSIFTDLIGSADDDDDLQIKAKFGIFTAGKQNISGTRDHDSYPITYEFTDSMAYKAGSDKGSVGGSNKNKGSKQRKNAEILESFMNRYAISPIEPSNVVGSDNAGKTYTFEWEEEFPWDGDYVFNVQADNEAYLFVDNDAIGDKIVLGSGGAAGHVLSPPVKIKKFMKAGARKISLNLLNHQIREMERIQTDVVDTSDEVNFDISISSMFANGITIEGLGIDVSKEYGNGKDIKEKITKKVEYGRVYPVKFTSSNQRVISATSKIINFIGLNARNNPIKVTNNGTRLAFLDGSGNDINSSFTIINALGGTAKFSEDGKSIDVKGDSVQVTLSLSWNDNPRIAGKAVDRIKIGTTTWTQTNTTKSSDLIYRYVNPDGTLSISDGKQSPWIKSYQNDTNWVDNSNVAFLRSHAVFPVHDGTENDKDHRGTWYFNIATGGNYTLEVQSDDTAKMEWDNNLVGSTTWSDQAVITFTINNISVGEHQLAATVRNNGKFGTSWYSNPGGVAWKLKDPSGNVVATSLDPFNDPGLPLRSVEGGETHTITLSGGTVGGNNNSKIQLRTKGEKVVQMEDLPGQEAGSGGVGGPGFFDDLICAVNNGRFFGIRGDTCNFVVDPPIDSLSDRKDGERVDVFNTIDWIGRSNRKLWKINPKAGKDADFANKFGVLPFNPAEVEKVEKKRKTAPPTVKFEVGSDGKNYLKVIGNGRVKVGFEMNVNDNTRISGLALREVKIQADDGEILMDREVTRTRTVGRGRRKRTITTTSISKRSKHTGIGIFSPGKRYEIKSLGGSRTSGSIIGVDKTVIGYDDDISNGYDENANVKITSITVLDPTKQVESYFGYPDHPNASTDDYAGFHEIIWNNINFPEDGNYSIEMVVDDNAVLTFSKPNEKDIVIKKDGFRIRGDGKTGTGKSIEIKYFKAGNYNLKTVLEQVPGAPLAFGNPMLIAIDIKSAFLSNEIEVISAKSWNENPMGVALTIDAPMAPIPKEPPQQQEGRCPNNPLWTTRSTNSVTETWYPVNVDDWSKFTNRYAISPLPPLGLKGTDGAGVAYRNSWKVEIPYRGYYGVKATADNFGKLFIDGVEVLSKMSSFKTDAPEIKKVLLEKKTVDITVQVENEQQFIWQTIDQKIFSTGDWASKQNNTSTTIEGPKNIDVDFKVSIATMYAAGIKLFDGNTTLFDDNKGYEQPAVFENHNHTIEVDKVYDVEFTSSNQRVVEGQNGIQFVGLNASNNPINVTNNGTRIALKDSGGSDINASFTIENVTGGSAKFSPDGKSIDAKGDNVQVTFSLTWNDNPKISGVAVEKIKIGSTIWSCEHGKGESIYKYIKPDGTLSITDGKQSPWIKSYQNDTNWVDNGNTEFLRSYAVFPVHDGTQNDKLHTGIWHIDITTGGNYTLEVQSDDTGRVDWDDNFVGSTVWNDQAVKTFTINNVSVGTHKLRGEITNKGKFGKPWYSNPGGLAWVLKDPSGTIVATSLDPFNDTAYPLRTAGSVTKTVSIRGDITAGGSNNSSIQLRNRGKNVVEMEDIPQDFAAGTGGTNDEAFWFKDIVCSASDGEFYNIKGRKCKFRIPSKDKTTIEYGKGLTGGSAKNGVTYSGPPISSYATSKVLGPFLTPTWTTDEDYIANFNGKTWTMKWTGVDFPETGVYDIQAQADDKLTIKLDGVEISTAEVGNGITKTQFNAPKGKRVLELVLLNQDFNAEFARNPTVAAVKITRKVDVAKVDPKSGTALGKPWTVNPVGVSAILIPPPCPKKINGVGIVTDVIITDPGNGFDPPTTFDDPDIPSGPPVIMEIDKIIPEDEGINYGPDDKVCIVNTETGEEVCFIPPKGPFGEIPEFDPRKTPPAPPGPPDPTPEKDPPPPVEPDVGITAIPSVIVKGDCTNLIYTSARNTSLKIDKGVGNVPVVSRGEVKVCPPITTTYTITGDGGGGGGSGTGGGGSGPGGGRGGGANSASTVVTVVEDPDDPLLDSPDVPDLPPAPNGYRSYPQIIVRGNGTGISYKGIPVMKAVLDPIGVDPNRLIQVTDLPGLKQTGYYDGKPYYGAVFYENGIRYAGYYDTPGQKVQIYDTLQESIDGRIVTPPSAIQRSGTDINSNDPRLNIPGTPDNLS